MTRAAVSVALALATGMIAQSLARHLKIPGIVLLLGAGVLLGPDVAGLVQPDALGNGLPILVGFAVAVILFEGGLNLDLKRLRREAKAIRRLLTVGALVTAAGGAIAARYAMGWDWRLAVLFGTLVTVTGPTVITPLLRRIKLHHRVETVLEAEGVLIDAIGAVSAVVALEIVIGVSDGGFWIGPASLVGRLGFGLVLGAVGGFLIAGLLRHRKVVPEGLENVFTLSIVLALFQVSNAVVPESGIMTVAAAGMVVGNLDVRVLRDLMEFKEQLTVMFIGMLFVLLAADVGLEEVRALGLPGLAVVGCLMFVVRPLNVLVSTYRSGLNAREKLFLSWLAPRGVVAAAVASFFAETISEFGLEGGDALRALVFAVIAITVLVQGLSGGLVARFLGLRRPTHRGFAILGANELGHALGRELRSQGQEVLFVDNSPAACRVVEEDGFKVVYGNALEDRTLQRVELDDRAAFVAVTANDEVNYLVVKHAVEDFKIPEIYLGLNRGQSTVSAARVGEVGASVLFGGPRDLELWALRMRRGLGKIERWSPGPATEKGSDPFDMPESLVLPLLLLRGGKVFPVSDRRPLRKGDVVALVVFEEKAEEARGWLAERGWVPGDGTVES